MFDKRDTGEAGPFLVEGARRARIPHASPAVRRRRLTIACRICAVAFLAGLWALFFAAVPWLLESPYSPIPADQQGNVGAICLLVCIVLSVVGPLAILAPFTWKQMDIGLAPLLAEFDDEGFSAAKGENRYDRWADARVRAALKALHGRAEHVDGLDPDKCEDWPRREAEIESRIRRLSRCARAYIADCALLADEVAEHMVIDVSPESGAGGRSKVRAVVSGVMTPAADAVLEAARAADSILIAVVKHRGRSVEGEDEALAALDALIDEAERAVVAAEAG